MYKFINKNLYINNKLLIFDPIFKNKIIILLINNIIKKGKKKLAYKIVYNFVFLIKKIIIKKPLYILKYLIYKLIPNIIIKHIYINKIKYKIPIEIGYKKGKKKAIKYFIFIYNKNKKYLKIKYNNIIFNLLKNIILIIKNN
uniref:ribosomal protein S7 n=1 Tax=Balanophora yakushimensis TaxID=1128105 RepID=UPI002000B87A|nr:ribosomal protein S7 [Balanophora yakushimensis]UNQ87791.1 ribosomal protein S7 [Balanophora yakushimensis]